MLRIPLGALLVGTALLVVPAAAQKNSAEGQFNPPISGAPTR